MVAVHTWSRARWLNVIAILVGLRLLWWAHRPVGELLLAARDQEAVVVYLEPFGLWGVVIYCLALIIQVIVAAIPGHILMIAGGYVYGFPTAFLVSWLSIALAAQGAFALARWAGRPLAVRLAPAASLDKWSKTAENKGALFFLLAFWLPIFPADVMNYVAGLSPLPARRFFLVNVIGRLPVAFILTAFGANGFKVTPQVIALFVLAGVVLFAGWWHFIARR